MSFSDAELTGVYRRLRRFAGVLTRNDAEADDLTQETALKLLSYRETFDRRTDLFYLGCTILRNAHTDRWHQRKNDVHDPELLIASKTPSRPCQHDHAELAAALILLGRMNGRGQAVLQQALGDDYQTIAMKQGCDLGTVKSRINRGRIELAAIMSGEQKAPIKKGRCPRTNQIIAVFV